MRTRSFGTSDLVTSVIGFGSWPMGRGHYGAFDDSEAIAAVRAALDAGVTLYDTAAVYGWGASEELIGRALGTDRKEIVLVTKGGLVPNESIPGGFPPLRDSSKTTVLTGIEESLQRLGTDYVDLYLIHWPDEGRPFDEPMEALLEAQQAGKIRYGGVSNFSPTQMSECLETFPIVCNQVGYHLFDRRPEPEVFPFVREHGLGVMAYGPMAHGLLTGAFTPDTEFAEDDWRRSLQAFGQPIFEGEHFARNLRIVDRLKKIAGDNGKTVAQLAIAWVLSERVVSVALCGARQPAEIIEDIGGDWELPADVGQAIEDAVRSETDG